MNEQLIDDFDCLMYIEHKLKNVNKFIINYYFLYFFKSIKLFIVNLLEKEIIIMKIAIMIIK